MREQGLLLMVAEDISAREKAACRIAAQQTRRIVAQTYHDIDKQIARFADDLVTQFAPATVAGYWPIRDEVSPLRLMMALKHAGCHLCLPETGAPHTPLTFRAFGSEAELVDGPYKTKQPPPTADILLPHLILTPLLAFDKQGYRLGYGGGFYDRTLAALDAEGHSCIAVGIAYDEQEVPQVPIGPYDRRLTGILTNSGLYLA